LVLFFTGFLELNANDELPPPPYLFSHVSGSDVELSWGAESDQGSWISHTNGIPGGGVGTATAGTYRIASRWPADSLLPFQNLPLEKMALFASGEFSNYTLKVWRGENAEFLVFSKDLQNLIKNQWNEILFPGSLVIEPGEDYWFGLEVDQFGEMDMSATFDAGPAVEGFGDMIDLGNGWTTLSSQGFDGNWLLRVFLLNDELPEPLTSESTFEEPLPFKTKAVYHPISGKKSFLSGKSSLEPIGFNVYRDEVLLNDSPLNAGIYLDEQLEDGIYNYGVTAVYQEGESIAVEKTVQVGAPNLSLDPLFINDSLDGGQSFSRTLTLTNSGDSSLEWEVDNLPDWIGLSETNGSISSGDSSLIVLDVFTEGLSMGTHNFNILFSTNNFNNPVSPFPVNIVIDSPLILEWSVDTLSFGNIPVMGKKLLNAELTNLSDAKIFLYSFEASLPNTQVFNPTWAIEAGETLSVLVSFQTTEPIDYNGILSVDYFGAFGSGTLELPYSGKGTIMQPSNLTASLEGNLVTLNWLPPGADADELRFGNGLPFALVGTSAGLYEFAARFTQEDLMPYADKQLDEIGFYVGGSAGDFTVNVYTGNEATEPIFSQSVSPVPGTWNDIALPEPLMLSNLENLWLTYTLEKNELQFIAGVDGGPAVEGSGDLFRVNDSEWNTLTSFGFGKNWNIRGIVSEIETGETKTLNVGKKDHVTTGKSLPEVLGFNIYRNGTLLNNELPDQFFFTDTIEEGETYIYGVTAVFDFGESDPATVSVGMPATMSMPEGWEFTPTPLAHQIHIPAEVTQNGIDLIPGDMIGVFFTDEQGIKRAGGVALWNGENTVITAFGNDPESPLKDGFDYNEPLNWKIYLHQQGISAGIRVNYSQAMPHYDGHFKMTGLSMVEALEKEETVGIETDTMGLDNLVIYPNPSSGRFAISGLSDGENVRVFDASGRMVKKVKVSGPSVILTLNGKGWYIIEADAGKGNPIRKKLLVY